MGLDAGLDSTGNLVSIRIRSLDRPARSESVHRLTVFPVCV